MTFLGIESSDWAVIGTWFSGIMMFATVLITIYISKIDHKEEIRLKFKLDIVDNKTILTPIIKNVGRTVIEMEYILLYFYEEKILVARPNSKKPNSKDKIIDINEEIECSPIHNWDTIRNAMEMEIQRKRESSFFGKIKKRLGFEIKKDDSFGFRFIITTENKKYTSKWIKYDEFIVYNEDYLGGKYSSKFELKKNIFIPDNMIPLLIYTMFALFTFSLNEYALIFIIPILSVLLILIALSFRLGTASILKCAIFAIYLSALPVIGTMLTISKISNSVLVAHSIIPTIVLLSIVMYGIFARMAGRITSN